ncbi:hypothetical protein D8B26_007615 [Coccidioides posadasii str. Silveira]|uniref:Uncharacterized protein n=3 Tax=Coccidioides posadasii TaxID=199306 RepID=E9D2G6_COCPS|nr:hypothetical protein CPC735_016260 [Coccidioides posadasii C735 delta SOWgp]EER25025.1 hypothetical protein CPC735_016260 [Coccidioides posadasii C735 delta SOWgp]EFW19380.1 conserved hypothetical protein [Coccidioides posadasii str. Silveira]KMM71840.1 hypothetical protein CPAG_08141 [Coccidioides posadasii RMSCC 3488]QVM12998.1 hypothetical protein D8B26_007615 [Coccidioides posadasii str. Silveira]|eukprot:XP_003067170.1 hypothetical protein CPC735_016260 [Coccidioides posadasii C735 delta SOWgp]
MPPHLHPRSRSTTSLFTATLLASFLIVGMPHLFPCPAPRRTLADSEMITMPDGQQRIRRRRRKETGKVPESPGELLSEQAHELDDAAAEFRHMDAEARRLTKMGRECPVPKPKGIVGQILGLDARRESGGGADFRKLDAPPRGNDG